MSDDAPPPSAAKPPPSTSSKKNIVSAEDPCQPRWQSGATESSLSALYEYVVRASMRSEEWYWKNKTWKARGSHFVRWTAVVLTGLAAILPVSIQAGLFPGLGTWLGAHGIIKQLDSGLLSSFLIAISAGLVAFDRASGLSSGWARYVLTGAAIRSACEEFRMDWMALRSQLEDPAKPEQIAALIQRAKTFRMAVEGLVMKETQEWATEFQNNLAEMEKDLKGQVEQARLAREKSEQELKERTQQERERQDQVKAARDAAQRPGSVEAVVVNAADTDGFKFDAALENGEKTIHEPIESSQTWACVGVPPGQYKLTVRAQVKKRPVASMIVIAVKPGETTKAEVTLPPPPAP